MKTIKIILAVFLIIGLASCTEKKTKEETIQLIWWGDIYNRDFAGKLVEAYNKTNPAREVSLIAPADDYWMKLQTMIAGGTAPDVFILNAEQAYELADKGTLFSLNGFKNDVAYRGFQEDIWKNLKNQLTYNGHLYAIPIWTASIGIFYNKNIFDQAGVEYPSKDWDLEELLDKAKRLTSDTNGDGKTDQFGFGGIPLSIDTIWDLHMLIKAFDGKLYSDDFKKCLINTSESMAAVRWAIELITRHHVAPGYSEISSTKSVVSARDMDLFRMGKVAMVLWGRWYMDILSKRTDFEWQVVSFPRGKQKVMFNSPVYLGTFSGTKYPQACWDFLKFVMSKEAQKMLAFDRTDIPVLRSVAYSPEFLNYGNREEANRIFLDMLEYSETPVSLSGKGKWLYSARQKFESVALGQLTVEEACNQIAAEFSKE